MNGCHRCSKGYTIKESSCQRANGYAFLISVSNIPPNTILVYDIMVSLRVTIGYNLGGDARAMAGSL